MMMIREEGEVSTISLTTASYKQNKAQLHPHILKDNMKMLILLTLFIPRTTHCSI